MVKKLTHPNLLDDFVTLDIEVEDNLLELDKIKVKILDRIEDKRYFMEAAVKLVTRHDLLEDVFRKKYGTGLLLNVNAKRIVEKIDELVLGLDLKLHTKGAFKKVHSFDTRLFHDEKIKKKFHNLIFNREGMLNEEGNYFWVDSEHLSDQGKACTLRNTRVILYWRDLELSDYIVKRILTLGLDFLIMEYTKEELIAKILDCLPNGVFEVNVKREMKTFVLISIEKPLLEF